MENPIHGININGKDRFMQRVEGDYDEWIEVEKKEDGRFDYVPSGGAYPYHQKLLGHTKKEAVEKLKKEEG